MMDSHIIRVVCKRDCPLCLDEHTFLFTTRSGSQLFLRTLPSQEFDHKWLHHKEYVFQEFKTITGVAFDNDCFFNPSEMLVQEPPFSSHTAAQIDAMKLLVIKMLKEGIPFPRFPGDTSV